MNPLKTLIGCLAVAAALTGAHAQEQVLNLYSARHYAADESLYADFTRKTGIRIRRIEGREEELIERIRNEGAESPADVFITVDAARLSRAVSLGLLAPVKSQVLESHIPAHLRGPDWFAFSQRVRMIVTNKLEVKSGEVRSYEDLAAPRFKGRVCARSGLHPYNLSLVSSMIAHRGEAAAEAWTKALVANFARSPRGGDIDQIRAVAVGECAVALVNSYYLVRMQRSTIPEDRDAMERVGIVRPNQDDVGTHVNISGGGVLKTARNREAAIRFLEYLVSDDAQAYFADGNNEWPVVTALAGRNRMLAALGKVRLDELPVSKLLEHTPAAQRIVDRAGWR
jgi:iron(III) transport system substrate-binding protein